MYLWRDYQRGYVFVGYDMNRRCNCLEIGWGANPRAKDGELYWRHFWVVRLRSPIRLKFGWGRVYFEFFGRSWVRRLPWL